MTRVLWAWMLALGLVSHASAAAPDADVYQPDWSAIAKHMVERSLALAPGERVLISHDPARDPGLVAALRTQIVRAGGIVSGEIVWPDAAIAKYLDGLS